MDNLSSGLNLCSQSFRMRGIYTLAPGRSLADEIKERRLTDCRFQETEVIHLLECLVQSLVRLDSIQNSLANNQSITVLLQQYSPENTRIQQGQYIVIPSLLEEEESLPKGVQKESPYHKCLTYK